MKKEQRVSDELKSINKVLDTFSLGDVSAAIFLDIRNQKKTGDYPVKIRVNHKREQQYHPAKDISIEDWETLKSGISPRGKLLDKKKDIYISFNNIVDIIKDLAPGNHFTLTELNTRLSGGTKDSILEAFKVKMNSLVKEGRIGSSVWYSCAKESIDTYLNPWKKEFKKAKDKTTFKKGTEKDLKFSQVTPEWLTDYEAHLKKEKKEDTTVSMYMRALRAIINVGMKKGVIAPVQYPFGEDKYEIPEGEGRKLALTSSQFMDVINCDIPAEYEKWRDLWVFSFYCNGANINDILRFKDENIKRTIKGNVIEWHRQKTIKRKKKTARKIKAFITEEMKDIMAKYNGNDYIFPYLSDGLTPTREREIIQQVTHNINRHMKKIGESLGIEKLTTYVARHSFADISKRSGVEVDDISESMGHAKRQTTDIYLKSLNVDEIIKNAAKLPRRKII